MHVGEWHFERGQRGPGAALDVRLQHLRVVHLVHVIAREDDHVPRRFALQRVEVLVDRVGGAQIPVVAHPLLRGQDLDELAELLGDDAPALADVPVERQGLVLGRDEDAPQAGVDAVAQGKIDDAIRPAEVHRGFGAVLGQGIKPLADAAGQHDDEGVFQHACSRSQRASGGAGSYHADLGRFRPRSASPRALQRFDLAVRPDL